MARGQIAGVNIKKQPRLSLNLLSGSLALRLLTSFERMSHSFKTKQGKTGDFSSVIELNRGFLLLMHTP